MVTTFPRESVTLIGQDAKLIETDNNIRKIYKNRINYPAPNLNVIQKDSQQAKCDK